MLLGTLANAVLIIIGSLIGRIFKQIPEKMKDTVLSIIGLSIALLGIQMGFESNNFIILIISLVIGTIIGEWLNLEQKMIRLGKWIESFFRKGKARRNKALQKVLLQPL